MTRGRRKDDAQGVEYEESMKKRVGKDEEGVGE